MSTLAIDTYRLLTALKGGIVLASNGIVIALLARIARVV